MGLAKVRVIPLAPVPPPIWASKATVSPLVGTATGRGPAEPAWNVGAVEVSATVVARTARRVPRRVQLASLHAGGRCPVPLKVTVVSTELPDR